MTVAISINGTDYDVPATAADTNWAADQVAFEQALAAAVTTNTTDISEADAAITVLEGNRVKVLSKNVTPVGNGADTTEDNLMTYALAGGTLATNAQGVRVTAWGDGVSTAEATTLRGYFGATLLTTRIFTASQANTWRVVFEVFRTGATTQTATGAVWQGGNTNVTIQTNAAPAETLSGAVTIKFTGQRAVSSTANSVRQLGMVVEFLP